MTRIEIVTKLVAAQIKSMDGGITFITTTQIESAGELADIILEYNKAWEKTLPKPKGRMP